jgi:hypothetical protein
MATRGTDRGDPIRGYGHTSDVRPHHVDRTGAIVRGNNMGVAMPDAGAGPGRVTMLRRHGVTRHEAHPVLLGVEVELAAETCEPGQIARHARLCLGAVYAEAKADSSIRGTRGGVEIVTHPATIGAHRAAWRDWTAPAGATANSSCGMHVHVSRSALTPGQIDRIAYMMSRPGDRAAWRRVWRREPNNYCQAVPAGSFARRAWDRIRHDRYYALNLSPDKTIEFRAPASSTSRGVILGTLEFITALVKYCEPGGPAGLSPDRLRIGAMIDWMQRDATTRAETKHARAYLTRRGLITSRPSKHAPPVVVVDSDLDLTMPGDLPPALRGAESTIDWTAPYEPVPFPDLTIGA